MRPLFHSNGKKGETQMEEYAALIAFDWADTKHDGALLVKGETRPERFILPQRAEAIDTWATALRERFSKAVR